jgi:hypothetical protein
MTYQNHFKLADDFVSHVNIVVQGISDPFISSRYIGFISVSAVTVYELAIKEIFCTFADQEHKLLGNFVQSHFKRINGRIRLNEIKADYVPRFGKDYVDKFNLKIDNAELAILKNSNRSIKSSYDNIITWRNQFAHDGQVPATVTYQEVIDSYFAGKEIIHCLSKAMHS